MSQAAINYWDIVGLIAATVFGVLDYHTVSMGQVILVVCSLAASLKWRPNPVFVLLNGGLIGTLI